MGFEPAITHGAMHGPIYYGNTPLAGTNYLNEAVTNTSHVYAIEWNSTSAHWFVDGVQLYQVTKSQVQPGSPNGSGVFPQSEHVRRLHPRLLIDDASHSSRKFVTTRESEPARSVALARACTYGRNTAQPSRSASWQ